MTVIFWDFPWRCWMKNTKQGKTFWLSIIPKMTLCDQNFSLYTKKFDTYAKTGPKFSTMAVNQTPTNNWIRPTQGLKSMGARKTCTMGVETQLLGGFNCWTESAVADGHAFKFFRWVIWPAGLGNFAEMSRWFKVEFCKTSRSDISYSNFGFF
jgi:hypothetical protein